MPRKIMPGATEEFTVTLPVLIDDVDEFTAAFYHADETLIKKYTEANTDNVYTVDGDDPHKIRVFMDSADSILCENGETVLFQATWVCGNLKDLNDPLNIRCGVNLDREAEE